MKTFPLSTIEPARSRRAPKTLATPSTKLCSYVFCLRKVPWYILYKHTICHDNVWTLVRWARFFPYPNRTIFIFARIWKTLDTLNDNLFWHRSFGLISELRSLYNARGAGYEIHEGNTHTEVSYKSRAPLFKRRDLYDFFIFSLSKIEIFLSKKKQQIAPSTTSDLSSGILFHF